MLRSDKQVNFSSSIQSPMSCFGRGRTTSALVFIEHAMPSDLTNDGQWKNNITTFPLISSYFIEMLKKHERKRYIFIRRSRKKRKRTGSKMFFSRSEEMFASLRQAFNKSIQLYAVIIHNLVRNSYKFLRKCTYNKINPFKSSSYVRMHKICI